MNFRGLRQQQAEITEPSATPQHQYEKHFAPADHLMASAAADFGNPSVDRPRRAARWTPRSASEGTIQRASSWLQIIQRQDLSSKIRFRREPGCSSIFGLWANEPSPRCYGTAEYVMIAHPPAWDTPQTELDQAMPTWQKSMFDCVRC